MRGSLRPGGVEGPQGPPGQAAIVINVDDMAGADDDARFANALAQWDAYDGPGEILFGQKLYTMANQWVIPNDAAGVPSQKSLIIRGAGASHNGSGGAPLGGTIINMTSATGPAKIDTRGHGLITIKDISFKDTSGGTNPFFQTTNTTAIIERCTFTGSKSGQLCDQDVIVLGGGTRTIDGSSTAKYDGYGSVVRDCHFNHIRRGVWMRPGCNDAIVEGNTWWISCGAPDDTYGAVDLVGWAPTSTAIVGNRIVHNTFEVQNYPTVIRCGPWASLNAFIRNGFYDPSATTARNIYFDANSFYNDVIAGFSGDAYPHYEEHASSAFLNSFITTHQSQVSHIAQPWTYHSTAAAGGLRVEGTAVFAGGSQRTKVQPATDQADGSTLFEILRSALDDVAPGQSVFKFLQNGDWTITNSAGVTVAHTLGGRTMTTTGAISFVTNASNFDVRAAAVRLLLVSDGSEVVRMRTSPAASTRGAIQFNSTGPIIVPTTASPEASVTAPVGSIAVRDDGAAGTTPTLYVKESGTGNTGWVPMVSAKRRTVLAKTGSYTLVAFDDIVTFNTASGTATLPTAASLTGRTFTIKNLNATALPIATTSSETIDGAAPGTVAQWGVLRVVSDGTNWLTV